jgi:predicted glycoside hydrolase/deacetylase ChbG (UPF0249 family)
MPAALIITADDYGYRPSYDRGIVEAARAGAVDAVGAMVSRDRCDPGPLLETGVEIGLHLELAGWAGGALAPPGHRAGPHERERAVGELVAQLARFEALFGRPPAYLDGHRHCHAAPGLAAAMAQAARERGLPVRSVDAAHRRTLRCIGVPTPDRLIGRLDEREPALPAELREALEGDERLAGGATEWMVHPGHPDRDSESSYDRGRGEDLELLLELGDRAAWAARGIRRLAHGGVGGLPGCTT